MSETPSTTKPRRFTTERLLLTVIILFQVLIWVRLDRRDHRVDTPSAPPVAPPEAAPAPKNLPPPPGGDEGSATPDLNHHAWLIPPGTFSMSPNEWFERMDNLFENVIAEAHHRGARIDLDQGWEALAAMPAMDMREQSDEYLVVFNLPGVDPSDVSVTLEGRILSVHAPARLRQNGASVARFARRVKLPGPVGEAQLAQAVMTNGTLRISIPKGLWIDPQRGERRLF